MLIHKSKASSCADWPTRPILKSYNLLSLWYFVICVIMSSVMSFRVLSVFQHRCKASAYFHWSRGCSVWLLCFTTWSRRREIVSVCWKMKKEKQVIKLHNSYTKRMYDDVLMINDWYCSRMLVGAPWDGPPNNRKGDIYKCIVGAEKNSNCSKVNLGERNKYC